MDNQRIDDMGPAFEPATPEEFEAQGAAAFDQWWDELDPPGCCEQIELDYAAARCVWLAAYENELDSIGLVYDSAEVHGGRYPTVAELHLGYVVDRFHGGSTAIPTRAFVEWLARHEDDFCRYIDDAGQVHVCIKSRSDEPIPQEPDYGVSRVRRARPGAMRSIEVRRFRQWWSSLEPPASCDGRSLDVDEARVVWLAARARLWDALELVHESAKARAEVASTTADLQLAYLVDQHHDGRLTYSLDDVMDWSEAYDQKIHRTRNKDSISIRIESPE
jgi:hypothetical protein